MKYDVPEIRPIGEMGLVVEYGDETGLELGFRVSALAEAVQEDNIEGVLDFMITIRALGVVFDPLKIKRDDLIKEILRLDSELEVGAGELPSRLLVLPIWYDDPWSAETAERYGVPRNIDLVAETNGMTIEEFIKAHSSVDYWVGALGGNPGTYIGYALDPEYTLSAPKYENPRTDTPVGSLAIAGRETASYPVDVAGGFQLIGRAPFDWWDPTQAKNEVFKESPALTRVGDRHRYRPIGEDEYYAIREEVEAGTYQYDIRDETFDVSEWLEHKEEVKEAQA